MRTQDFDVQQLIDDLQGTCTSINDHLPEGMDDMDLTSEDHDVIDNQIFLCETCGWWCEISEQDEDGNCQDCHEASEEDEDE
jgi:hypothetical protein